MVTFLVAAWHYLTFLPKPMSNKTLTIGGLLSSKLGVVAVQELAPRRSSNFPVVVFSFCSLEAMSYLGDNEKIKFSMVANI